MPHHRLRAWIAAVLLALGAAVSTFAQAPPAQNPDAAILASFLERVKAYAALHEKLESTLEQLPRQPTADQVETHRMDLERLITRARASARPGDLFTDPVRAYIRRQLSRVFSGPDGQRALESIMDEDTRTVRLSVNGRYPTTVPLSTVPPQVLLVLPRLPEQLEYRFVGDQLILLDVHAGTVADFMEKAITR